MFNFFIPNGVIAEMGLTTDGETVSRWVRISDLFADGKMSLTDYLTLSKAGVVVTQQIMFTFESVEETAQGWNCIHIEPEPRAWGHTREFLEELFTGRQWQLWLPEPPPRGYFFSHCLVQREEVETFNSSETYKLGRIKFQKFIFSEGTLIIDDYCPYIQWVEMRLYTELDQSSTPFFREGVKYKFSEYYLLKYYE